MEVELMVTKRDNRQPTTDDRVNIEQSASGRLEGRVLQYYSPFVTNTGEHVKEIQSLEGAGIAYSSFAIAVI